MQIDLEELDKAIAAFGRATTQTEMPWPMRFEAETAVRDFLFSLRAKVTESNGVRTNGWITNLRQIWT